MENENVVESAKEEKVSEIEKMSDSVVTKVRKRRKDFMIELVLFFILGILIGVALKKEALKKITMGYDDYKMKIYAQDYDLNMLENQATQKARDAREQAAAQSSSGSVSETGNASNN